MQAEARQLEKQAAIDDALAGLEEGASDGMRGDAIRNAMRAYGFLVMMKLKKQFHQQDTKLVVE